MANKFPHLGKNDKDEASPCHFFKKGEKKMSEMLKDLVGERCYILGEDGEYLTGSPEIACEVLDIDGEWIKISYLDEMGNRLMRVSRIETVENVWAFLE